MRRFLCCGFRGICLGKVCSVMDKNNLHRYPTIFSAIQFS